MTTATKTDRGTSLAAEQYLSQHPFNKNVFVMMKYGTERYHRLIESNVRKAFEAVDYYNPVVAKDLIDRFSTLTEAVRGSIEMSRYGIALFGNQKDSQFNPNVAFEAGIMYEQNKEVLLLKDRAVPPLFADLSGYLYRDFDGREEVLRSDCNDLIMAITEWLELKKQIQENTLEIAFVSGIEMHIASDPKRAITHFETDIEACIQRIAIYAGLKLPDGDLMKQLRFLLNERQVTKFIFEVMGHSILLCRKLKRKHLLSDNERTKLLGQASVLRDIYNDWLRHYSMYGTLRKKP